MDAHSDDRFLARSPAGLTNLPGSIDLGGDTATGQSDGHAPVGLEGPKSFPSRLSQTIGKVLDVPGTTGRVDYPSHAGLLGEQQLGVAGGPPPELVRATDSRIEGSHGYCPGSANPG